MRANLAAVVLVVFLSGCAARTPARPAAPLWTSPDAVAAVPAVVTGGPVGALPAIAPSKLDQVPAVAAPRPALNPASWASQPQLKPVAPTPPITTAATALVLDEASGKVLHEQGAHARVEPASLTKIATAVVAIERGNLSDWATIDVDSRKMTDSTVMGLRPGDRFMLGDLLYGLMLPSGNDAALAIGRQVSGSDAAFVGEMNALARRLGLADTHFENAHGLSSPGHVTSAYDLGILSRYAMTLPSFRAIVGATTHTAKGSRTIVMGSLISGMLNQVPGVDGVKSGFTEEAGRTMVTSAMRGGHRVYVVVMNDTKREIDSANLLQWAFTNYSWPATGAVVAQIDPASAEPTSPPAPKDDVIRAARVR